MAQRQELELARELISEKQYDKARTLLRKVKNDPTALKWLEKLDELDPVQAAEVVVDDTPISPWQYGALEVKRSYGIQYKVNGIAHPEWKDQPIYFVLNELGREGWELSAFESVAEFSTYILKKPGIGKVEKTDVWDQ